jgi:hypothetical protein
LHRAWLYRFIENLKNNSMIALLALKALFCV